MNFDDVNKIFDYFNKEVYPYLHKRFDVSTFDSYIKRFSYMPHGKWIRELGEIPSNITKIQTLFDPAQFVKKYEDRCVTFNPPFKPEEGFGKIIYQISPTLHVESLLFCWYENNKVHSYITLIAFFKKKDELDKFIAEILPMRKSGNTEERNNTGFSPIQK